MDYVTTIRLLVRESKKPLKDVRVELFDRDEHSPDDSLGVAQTNAFGEATFKYKTRDFADNLTGNDDEAIKLRGSRDSVPDLYPVVYNRRGEVILSKRDEATHNNAVLNMLVLIDEQVARNHALLD